MSRKKAKTRDKN